MTQHPDEGTLHAYIDGELAPTEAAMLEVHVRECVRCAATLAEARGHAAAASRVITTLDAAPASAATAAPTVVGAVAAPARRAVRPPIFRLPYARAAALLLLVGGTAVVVERTGTLSRGTSTQAESLLTDAATESDLASTATVEGATAMTPARVPEPAAATDLSGGARGGVTGSLAQKAAAPPSVTAGTASDGTGRRAERSAPAPRLPAAVIQSRGVAIGAAAKDAAPAEAQAAGLPAAPPAAPARTVMKVEEVTVTSALSFGPTVSRYRTKDGTILTLIEEPLRTTFAEESAATRQNALPRAQPSVAAAMAAPAINTYRWSSAERGKTYTLSGPLAVTELEALSKRLSELERLP